MWYFIIAASCFAAGVIFAERCKDKNLDTVLETAKHFKEPLDYIEKNKHNI